MTNSRRRSTGKRLRFAVFDRDSFTCQYCGAQPPEVVLVIDHITPVASGGATSIDNLVTACEPCNQGKSDKRLGSAGPRPDADLMYLATQQEIAELRRYQQALALREQVIAEVIGDLQDLWCRVGGPDWHPVDRVVRELLDLYGFEVTSEAFIDVSPKVASRYVRESRFVPYLFKVARSMAEERGEFDGADEESGED